MPFELISDREVDGIRADVEQIFIDRCTVIRPGLHGEANQTTGQVETVSIILYTNLRCYCSPIMSRRDDVDEIAAGQVYQRQYRWDVPWDIDDIQIRDQITMTTSHDPQLVGRTMVVKDVVVGSAISYRRFTAIDLEE